jgi:hypothetical protein
MVCIFQLPFSSDDESSDGEGCYNYKGVTASLMIGSKNYVDSDGSNGDDDSVEELFQTARALIALPRPPVGRRIDDESKTTTRHQFPGRTPFLDPFPLLSGEFLHSLVSRQEFPWLCCAATELAQLKEVSRRCRLAKLLFLPSSCCFCLSSPYC